MKESFWAYLFIVLGLFVIVIMMLIQDVTTTDEEDFYLTKEVMEAAMVDSIDYGVYMDTGDIRIIQSKFVENFTRRFADSVKDSKNYTLEFYDIYEDPPKATVKVSTSTKDYSVTTDSTVNFDILTIMSGILETKYGGGSSKYSVTLTSNAASVTGSRKSASYNGAISFDVTAKSGYTLEGATVKCDRSDVTTRIDINVSNSKNGTVTVGSVKGKTSCTLTLNKLPYTISLSNANGTVKPSGNISVPANGSYTFTLTANDGYTLTNPSELYCAGNAKISINGNRVLVENINSSQNCFIGLRKK